MGGRTCGSASCVGGYVCCSPRTDNRTEAEASTCNKEACSIPDGGNSTGKEHDVADHDERGSHREVESATIRLPAEVSGEKDGSSTGDVGWNSEELLERVRQLEFMESAANEDSLAGRWFALGRSCGRWWE